MKRVFMVFHDPTHSRLPLQWSAYTRDANPEWKGFVGWFEVEAATHAEGKKLAIEAAKRQQKEPRP
jgi:hypothetical protein